MGIMEEGKKAKGGSLSWSPRAGRQAKGDWGLYSTHLGLADRLDKAESKQAHGTRAVGKQALVATRPCLNPSHQETHHQPNKFKPAAHHWRPAAYGVGGRIRER